MSDCPIVNSCTGNTITFSCAVGGSVTLKANKDTTRKLIRNTIETTTKGKQKVVIGGFPVYEQLILGFKGMSKASVESFMGFYIASAGLEITMVDICNKTWVGCILDEDIKVTNTGAGLGCATTLGGRLVYEFSVTFEGVKS
jgi:hypothetical protein